jgi:hypothetical protein
MAQTLFELDAETKKRAQHKALDLGLSLAEVLRSLVAAWLRDELTVSVEDTNEQQISTEPGSAT